MTEVEEEEKGKEEEEEVVIKVGPAERLPEEEGRPRWTAEGISRRRCAGRRFLGDVHVVVVVTGVLVAEEEQEEEEG